MQETINKILELDIVSIIEKHVTLKKAGVNYKGKCPFHNENTASFTVNETKGIFKCFGCGKGGNGINFIMEKEKLNFLETIEFLANEHDIPFKKGESDFDLKRYKLQDNLKIINEHAQAFFIQELKKSKKVMQYALSRFKPETIDKWDIGFASDDWHKLRKEFKDKNFNIQNTLDSQLLREKDEKIYDFFYYRLIFPINDKFGRTVGFSGRTLNEDYKENKIPKYLNTPDTIVYKKEKILFGLFQAREAINKEGYVFIVEGTPDCIKLHELGIENTVAPCGTALTLNQLDLLKRYTEHIVLLYDGDTAGRNAILKNGKLALKQGFSVSVLPLPDEEDPESFFSEIRYPLLPQKKGENGLREQFKIYFMTNTEDFVIYISDINFQNVEKPAEKNRARKAVCKVLSILPESDRNEYIEDLRKRTKTSKKDWVATINELTETEDSKDKSKYNKDDTPELPEGVDPNEFLKYGFYEYKNEYRFRTKEGIKPISNFILIPLFHIEGITDSLRLFEAKNNEGLVKVIEMDINTVTSVQGFRKILENRGHFIWRGNDTQLINLRDKLYKHTKTCEQIDQLGWQKRGFWAFGNGIYTNKFIEADKYGIVEHNNRYYFLPAFSSINKEDDSIYQPERRFIYKKNDVTFSEWTELFVKVFGDNAKIALSYIVTAFFRDLIFDKFNFFPHLNLFGPPGTGKSEMARSIMYLFGEKQDPISLFNSTKVSISEYFAQFNNAIAWCDEFKNDIEYDKTEILKGAYDGVGRKRGSIDKGAKTKTTSVNSAIMISGQEIPTVDAALLMRVILLQFFKTIFSTEEQQLFNEFQRMTEKGLSHLATRIIEHREEVKKDYMSTYEIVIRDLSGIIGDAYVKDRILRNMCCIVTGYKIFTKFFEFNFTYEELLEAAKKNIIAQSEFINTSNETALFWKTIDFLVQNNDLVDKEDFKIMNVIVIKHDKGEQTFLEPKNILLLKMSKVHQLYAEAMRKKGEKHLPENTLKYYLTTSPEFIGTKRIVRFQSQVTSAFIFDYDRITTAGHSLIRTADRKELENDDLESTQETIDKEAIAKREKSLGKQQKLSIN